MEGWKVMGKFCAYCGGPTKETDTFCGKCGRKVEAAAPASAPVAPVSEPAVYQQHRRPAKKITPLQKAANSVMKVVHLILIGMLIFTLTLGIMNFSAKHSVSVTAVAKYGSEVQKETQKVVLSEIYETEEFIPYALAGLAYGVLQCVLTLFAGLIVFQRLRGNKRLKKIVKSYSMTGLIGSGLYVVLTWILGSYKEEYGEIVLKASIAPHFTVWISLVLFALLFAVAAISKTKRRRR